MKGDTFSDIKARPEETEEFEEAAIRERLRKSYGVESMFVRVKTLSRVLGIPAATIYASMRAGRFPIPHVVMCSAPMARTDDLVKWIAGSGARAAAPEPAAAVAVAPTEQEPASDATLFDASQRSARRRLRQTLIADALKRMEAAADAGDTANGQ